MAFDYELLTIGAGSGGVAATRRAGNYGVRAAICEEDRGGGTCVLRGCIPKKLLVYASHFAEELGLFLNRSLTGRHLCETKTRSSIVSIESIKHY